MNGTAESKSEIQARIEELRSIMNKLIPEPNAASVRNTINSRIVELELLQRQAVEDIHTSILESHKAICNAKNMGEKEAYGNNPALYYTLAIAGECGEMANSIVKNCRNGYNAESVLDSIKSELPDVVIYSFILAHVMGIDISMLVSDKCKTVVARAESGYYGGPLR